MSKQCCSGGLLKCSMSLCPTAYNVLPINMTFTTTPAGNIMDNKPMINIPSFGMCTSPLNPLVIANFGAPAPCMPIIAAPWFIGVPNVLLGNMPALNDQSKCMCLNGGIIGINFPGQIPVNVG